MTTRRPRRFQPALGYDLLESRCMLDASTPPPVDTPPDPTPDPGTVPTDDDPDSDPDVLAIDNDVSALSTMAVMPMVFTIAAGAASTRTTLITVIEAARSGFNKQVDDTVADMKAEIKFIETDIDKATSMMVYVNKTTAAGQAKVMRLQQDIDVLELDKANLAIDAFRLSMARDTVNTAVDTLEAMIKVFTFPDDDGDDPALGLTYYTNDELDFSC